MEHPPIVGPLGVIEATRSVDNRAGCRRASDVHLEQGGDIDVVGTGLDGRRGQGVTAQHWAHRRGIGRGDRAEIGLLGKEIGDRVRVRGVRDPEQRSGRQQWRGGVGGRQEPVARAGQCSDLDASVTLEQRRRRPTRGVIAEVFLALEHRDRPRSRQFGGDRHPGHAAADDRDIDRMSDRRISHQRGRARGAGPRVGDRRPRPCWSSGRAHRR